MSEEKKVPEEKKKVSSVSAQEMIKDSISSTKTLLSKIAARNPTPVRNYGYGGYGGGYYGGYGGGHVNYDHAVDENLDNEYKDIVKKESKKESVSKDRSSKKTSLKGTCRIYTPAGECPYKPEGYKKVNWEIDPTPEEVIVQWAMDVYDSAPDGMTYAPEAIVYWAQFYWKKELSRVKKVILDFFKPNRDFKEDDYI